MAVLTRADFARKAGIGLDYLKTYINRKKIVMTVDGFIDDTHEVNAFFLQTRKGYHEEELTIPIFEDLTRDNQAKPYNNAAEKKMVEIIMAAKKTRAPFPMIPTGLLFNLICGQMIEVYEFMLQREVEVIRTCNKEPSPEYINRLTEWYTGLCKERIEKFNEEVSEVIDDIVSDHAPKSKKNEEKIKKGGHTLHKTSTTSINP